MIEMYTILYNFIYNMEFTVELIETYWLNWNYSLTGNFDLSLINVFWHSLSLKAKMVFYFYIWNMDLVYFILL